MLRYRGLNVADKLMIVLANTDPDRPGALAAPFSQATVAAAMEYDVEIVMTGAAGVLARRGMAEQITVGDGDSTVYRLIREAHDAGVRFKLCTPPLPSADDELIAEIDETVGAAYLISEAMDDATVTFTY